MENKIKNTGTAKVTIGKNSYELPIMAGSMGVPGIDVRALHKNTGCLLYTSPSPRDS